MVDSLDISFQSLNILSPSSKLAAEEALAIESVDSEDDRESFDEGDCVFADRGIEDDEVHEGSNSQYWKGLLQLSRVHPQSHSASRGNEEDKVHEGPFYHYSRMSAQLKSPRTQRNPAARVNREHEAYESAFSHYSRASAKANSGRPRLNYVSSRSDSVYHEKENEIPRNSDLGGKSDDIQLRRLDEDEGPGWEPFASYDDRSSPLNIMLASPNTVSMRRSRKTKKQNLSARESLLAEAWERKRELMLNEELANFNERAKPELLGRSTSDCGGQIADVAAPLELRRTRTRSLTDDDFEELRGCIDLGFRFDQSAIPDLCATLPALEVYCAVAQNFQESPNFKSPGIQSPAYCSSPSTGSSWKVSSPGDDPRDVKGRLKHWAQAVACNARLCY